LVFISEQYYFFAYFDIAFYYGNAGAYRSISSWTQNSRKIWETFEYECSKKCFSHGGSNGEISWPGLKPMLVAAEVTILPMSNGHM
jgi:hypothetical protein